jgi:hypothetical protein
MCCPANVVPLSRERRPKLPIRPEPPPLAGCSGQLASLETESFRLFRISSEKRGQ